MPVIVNIRLAGKIFRVKDCRGLSSVRGLMFDSLKDYDGALIYSNSVWMPFVKHKLTLFFLGKDFRIIETQNAVPITLNPKTWRVYSCCKAKYCLEVKGILREAKKMQLQEKRIIFF